MLAVASATSSSRSGAFVRAGALAAIVLVLDRVTKSLVSSSIPVGQHRGFLPAVQLVHVRNTGVAFSLFSGGGAPVLILTLAALAALISYLARRPERRGLWVPTGLLVGGAVGNLIDRIASGAVTDFIKLPHWPAFNVADMSITFGVLALLLVIEGRRGDGR
ncbi:MAG: signal peptidase II [Actinomycetota bacterium]|nr:signal peptidase II [Actinomycetota bacterium]